MKLRRLIEDLSLTKHEQAVIAALVSALLLASAARIRWQQLALSAGPTVVRSPRSARTRIDLNTAEWFDLVILPGIGPKRAKQIVAARRQQPGGRFEDVGQLKQIKGMPAKVVDGLRPYVSLGSGRGKRP